jgi:hypothetical protein
MTYTFSQPNDWIIFLMLNKQRLGTEILSIKELSHLNKYPHVYIIIIGIVNVDISWDIVPCSQYVNRCFGGTCHLHLQGRK